MARGMKRSAVAALVAAGGLAGGWAGGGASAWGQKELNPTCGHAKAMRSLWQAGRGGDPELPWVRQILRESMGQTDVLHNDLDIEVLPATRSVQGSNTMTVKSLVDGLAQFSFRLRSNMTIAQCLINGTTVVPVQTLGTTGRVVALDRVYNHGEVFTLKVSYSGSPADVDDAITYSTTSDGLPNIFTLSEPFGASAWWPCKDVDYAQPGDNSDKATLDIAITVPGTISAVSNGLPMGVEDLTGGRKKFRWSTAYPLSTYLVCFAAANYASWSKPFDYPAGSMPVMFNVYAIEDSPTRRANAEKVIGMLGTMGTPFGVYPFTNEKYGIYEFGWPGGMEHQTNTGQCCFNDESLTVHEMSHQWWGDNVTCKTWGDIWLNEGFATYGEALWAQYKPGSSGFAALKQAMRNRKPTGSGSVYCYDTSHFSTIFAQDTTYYKGAWVLHMLRGLIGDQAFFDTLKVYRNAYTGGAATTDDFAAVASSVSGRDLTSFFDQWVYQHGMPSYLVGRQDATIAGRKYLRIHIRQQQSTSFGLGGTFRMPLTVKMDVPSMPSVIAQVQNTARLQYFLFPVPGTVTAVTLDPDEWVLNATKGAEMYIPGPAKVAVTTPAPGAQLETAVAPDRVTVVFSENVTASAAAFSVQGPSGPVPFTMSYDALSFTATLSFSSLLPVGDYTVSVADSVKSVAGNAALDGEIADPASAASLPSGDGLAGGAGAFTFSVLPPACAADVDGDRRVNFGDYLEFLNRYDAGDLSVDFTHDGLIDVGDYLEFLNLYEAGC